MSEPARILVVDDTPANVKLLADLAAVSGYRVSTASSGAEALAAIAAAPPDLVLLDVVMPGMSGYDVCREIRAATATAMLPVIMVTALDPVQERIKGLEAGADDFLIKPIHPPELIARVRSLLRIKRQIERLERLKRFFSPKLADLIVSGGAEDPLVPHRRDIVVVFLDLRGFTALAESIPPEALMGVLREYHEAMGELILAHEGTLERFGGDSIMVFFNDPVPVERPAARAAHMACAMRERFRGLAHAWSARGHRLGLGIGLAQGAATLGAIGFEGRWDYAAIGPVTNLAARLCAEAADGEILLDQATLGAIADQVESRPVGERALKGFARPVAVYNLLAGREPRPH